MIEGERKGGVLLRERLLIISVEGGKEGEEQGEETGGEERERGLRGGDLDEEGIGVGVEAATGRGEETMGEEATQKGEVERAEEGGDEELERGEGDGEVGGGEGDLPVSVIISGGSLQRGFDRVRVRVAILESLDLFRVGRRLGEEVAGGRRDIGGGSWGVEEKAGVRDMGGMWGEEEKENRFCFFFLWQVPTNASATHERRAPSSPISPNKTIKLVKRGSSRSGKRNSVSNKDGLDQSPFFMLFFLVFLRFSELEGRRRGGRVTGGRERRQGRKMLMSL